MTHEEEMVIRVKFQDTYKTVANYIRNGLGVTKETVEAYIRDFVKEAIRDYIQMNPEFIDGLARKIVREEMDKVLPGSWRQSGLQKYVSQIVETSIQKQVKAAIDARVTVQIVPEKKGDNA